MPKRGRKDQSPVSSTSAGATGIVKTSVGLPRELWKAAHLRALDEGCDLQDVITAALAAYLKTSR
jgi:hypothetical protein